MFFTTDYNQNPKQLTPLVALGTHSLVKKAAIAPFCHEVLCFGVSSEVPDQPVGDAQTRKGAVCRSQNAWKAAKEAGASPSFAVGLEGGVAIEGEHCYLVNWGALYYEGSGSTESQGFLAETGYLSHCATGCTIESCGPRLELPSSFISDIRKGKELSDILQSFKQNVDVSLESLCKSAMALFSNGAFSREQMFHMICHCLVGQYALRVRFPKLFNLQS